MYILNDVFFPVDIKIKQKTEKMKITSKISKNSFLLFSSSFLYLNNSFNSYTESNTNIINKTNTTLPTNITNITIENKNKIILIYKNKQNYQK